MSKLEQCCLSKKFQPVTHCIFDLDGTILDTEGIYKKTFASILVDYGYKLTDEYHVTLTGMQELEVCQKVANDFELPITAEEVKMKFRERSDAYIPDAEFMPGAVRLIQHLHEHGIPMAIGTSSPQNSADLKFRNKRKIFDLFKHVVCGSSDPEVIHGKPAPDIFLVAAKRFTDRPPPSQCLVFEDATNGVKAALSAGMQVIMTPAPEVPYENWKLATLRLDSLEYMVPELFGLPAFPSPETDGTNQGKKEELPGGSTTESESKAPKERKPEERKPEEPNIGKTKEDKKKEGEEEMIADTVEEKKDLEDPVYDESEVVLDETLPA